MSPAARRAATFSILTANIVALSRREPVLILLEDAHWAEAREQVEANEARYSEAGIGAAEGLAEVMRGAGRAVEGRQLLAEVAERFGEGQALPLLRRVSRIIAKRG